MICGFGRFIRADDTSKNMTDLRAYRCKIAVDDINEIPRRLAIVIGDEVVDILVHLESSVLVRAGRDGHPPPSPPPESDNAHGGGGLRGRLRDDERGLVSDDRGGAGSGAADTTDLDRHSEISVNRAPGSTVGNDELPLPIVDGVPRAAGLLMAGELCRRDGRRSDRMSPQVRPSAGRRLTRGRGQGGGPIRCSISKGWRSRRRGFGSDAIWAEEERRRSAGTALRWRPVGRVCMETGRASQELGRSACLDFPKKGDGGVILAGKRGGTFSDVFTDSVKGGEVCSEMVAFINSVRAVGLVFK